MATLLAQRMVEGDKRDDRMAELTESMAAMTEQMEAYADERQARRRVAAVPVAALVVAVVVAVGG